MDLCSDCPGLQPCVGSHRDVDDQQTRGATQGRWCERPAGERRCCFHTSWPFHPHEPHPQVRSLRCFVWGLPLHGRLRDEWSPVLRPSFLRLPAQEAPPQCVLRAEREDLANDSLHCPSSPRSRRFVDGEGNQSDRTCIPILRCHDDSLQIFPKVYLHRHGVGHGKSYMVQNLMINTTMMMPKPKKLIKSELKS